MPTTMPGISITEAQKLLQVTDRIIKSFPEVERVLGKAGRAGTSTDPAPLSMLETVVTLKPKSEWRRVADLVLRLGARVAEAGAALDELRPHLAGGARPADERRAAAAGALQRLDHADQGPDRHARHRHPHPGRAQDLGGRPRGDRAARDRGQERCSRRCPALAASSPSAPRPATSSTSGGSGRSWPATGSASRRRRPSSAAAIGGETVTTTIEGRERYSRERPLPARLPRATSARSAACSSRGRRTPDPARPARRDRDRDAAPA